jgi:hypothetical protein
MESTNNQSGINVDLDSGDRSFNLDTEGYFDANGFYHTPNGSFWDPEGNYFNRRGYDKYGGYYNQELVYVQGDKINQENYEDIDEIMNDSFLDDDDDLDDYEEIGAYREEENDYVQSLPGSNCNSAMKSTHMNSMVSSEYGKGQYTTDTTNTVIPNQNAFLNPFNGNMQN